MKTANILVRNWYVSLVSGIPVTLLFSWSGRGDLNARPPAPKAGALPGCATPRHLKLL